VFDELVELPEERMHSRWILALDDHRALRIVIARCITVDGPSPTCEAALESVRLRVQPPLTPEARDIAFRKRMLEKYGLVIGLPVLAVLVVLLIWLRRSRARVSSSA
jgi:hypothetical protein